MESSFSDQVRENQRENKSSMVYFLNGFGSIGKIKIPFSRGRAGANFSCVDFGNVQGYRYDTSDPFHIYSLTPTSPVKPGAC